MEQFVLNIILQLGYFSLIITLINIGGWFVFLFNFLCRELEEYTWYFSKMRVFVIVSLIFILLLLFIINYIKLGRTVYLDQIIVIYINSYYNLMKYLLVYLNIINVILINLLLLVMLYACRMLFLYYLDFIRVSFISLYIYLEYLDDEYGNYISKKLFSYSIKVSIFEDKIHLILYYFFFRFYNNHDEFMKSKFHKLIWYKPIRFPIKGIVSLLKKYSGIILLIYYIYLFLLFGQIELKNIYYVLIFFSIYRLLINIIYFILVEKQECIYISYIIKSIYMPVIRLNFVRSWFSIIGNLKNKGLEKIIYEFEEKVSEGEIKSFEDAQKFLHSNGIKLDNE